MPKAINSNTPIFYTYLILDPRKQGTFIYDGGKLSLDYLPIYIGKGCGYRCNVHISDAKNTDKESDKLDVLRELLYEGLEPIIIKILKNVTEKEALDKEILCSEIIKKWIALPLINDGKVFAVLNVLSDSLDDYFYCYLYIKRG